MKYLGTNLRMFLWMTVLTGILYPLFVTSIAKLAMKQRADGEFVISHGTIIGAKLIAQKFESEHYFWPRPSAVDYNPLPSGGSNLGPTSSLLKKQVQERKDKILKTSGMKENSIPSEFLFASGSGLDPDITPSGAYFQIKRILNARKLDPSFEQKIRTLIDHLAIKRRLGFLGEPCVNVLILNIALDELTQDKQSTL